MVQIHLGPLNVSPGRGSFHPDEHCLKAPGISRTQRKLNDGSNQSGPLDIHAEVRLPLTFTRAEAQSKRV